MRDINSSAGRKAENPANKLNASPARTDPISSMGRTGFFNAFTACTGKETNPAINQNPPWGSKKRERKE
jgi:hypothetical protein